MSEKHNVRNKLIMSINISLLILFFLLNGIDLNAQNLPSIQNNPANQNRQAPANIENRAPQSNQAARPQMGPLRAPDVMPGTLPEMREPSYWISKMSDPDAVILTSQQIQTRNRNYIQRLANYSQIDSLIRKQINAELSSRPGLLTSIPDVTPKSQVEISEMIAGWIDKEITFMTRRRASNILGIQYADWEIKNISDEMASAKNSEQIDIQDAITVKNCRLRIVPSIRPEYTSGTSWDMWNYDILPISTPVKILSKSKSGGYFFVLTERGYGWVNSEDVAAGSQGLIENFCNSRDFILCTGEKVPYYSDSSCTIVSGWFRMGDHLGIRDIYSTREVIVPVRLINGKLSLQNAWLKKDADVNRGIPALYEEKYRITGI
jgi:hypothetical protein